MTREQWRTAVTRWGDPVLAQALLLTNRRSTAEAATVSAFVRVLAGTHPAELETLLLAALFQELTRRRFPRWPRRGALPGELVRISPIDRFVLGLWLLRGLDGKQIATITGLPPEQVVERLARVMDSAASTPPSGDAAGHMSLPQWLAEQLAISAPSASHPRPCDGCRRRKVLGRRLAMS